MSSRTNTEPASVWRQHKDLSQYLGQQGTVRAFTKIHHGPAGLIHRTPYHTAIVRLPELKKNMVLEVVRENDQAIAVGGKVELVMRKHKTSEKGLIQYSIKARVL